MTIDEAIQRYVDNAEYERTHENLQGCLEFKQLVKWMKELKQLKEQTRWIPCSERLPEKSGRYLVTRGLKGCNNLWNEIYIVNYSDLMGLCKEKVWWDGNVGKSDFEAYDDVLAWRPLSERYEYEGDNNDK